MLIQENKYLCRVSLKSLHYRDIASRETVVNGQKTDGPTNRRMDGRTTRTHNASRCLLLTAKA